MSKNANKYLFKKTPVISYGAKGSGDSSPFDIKPKAYAEKEEVPRMNEGNPDHQIVLPRTTLFSVSQNHGREKHHVARGNPLEDCKRDSKPYGLAIGEWGRDNPRRSLHLRIKYPQLTP